MLFARLFSKPHGCPSKKIHGVNKFLETFCGQPISKKLCIISSDGLNKESITCKKCLETLTNI
jgi:hypothetical protein